MLRRLIPVLSFLTIQLPAYASDLKPISLDTIVNALQARDKALESFEIQGREFISDENGNRIETGVMYEFTYACAHGGRVELRNVVHTPGVAPKLNWYRDDGQKIYQMSSFGMSAEVVDSVGIRPTPNSSSENRVRKNIVLHSLKPLGVRLPDLVSTARNMRVLEEPNGDRSVSMTVRKGNGELSIVLSERHDFLPSRIDFGNGYVISVTEFQLVDGFWFPKKGVHQMRELGGKPITMAFTTNSVLVNFHVDSDRFGMPKLEAGAQVEDETTNSSYVYGAPRNDLRAAKRLRAAFERKYHGPISNAKSGERSANIARPVETVKIDTVADQAPERSSIPRWALGLSIGTIAAACFLGIRMRT